MATARVPAQNGGHERRRPVRRLVAGRGGRSSVAMVTWTSAGSLRGTGRGGLDLPHQAWTTSGGTILARLGLRPDVTPGQAVSRDLSPPPGVLAPT